VSLLKYELTEPTLAPNELYESSTQGLFNVTRCAATGPGTADASGRVMRDDSATEPPLGPPLYLTLPHFCRAPPELAAQTEGTTCNMSRHDMWLGVEPTSGVTLASAKRLQLVSEFDSRWPVFDRDVAPTKLPIFWVEEEAEAPEYDLHAIRDAMAVCRLWPLLRFPLALLNIELLGSRIVGAQRKEASIVFGSFPHTQKKAPSA
jgi:hypothetical protein